MWPNLSFGITSPLPDKIPPESFNIFAQNTKGPFGSEVFLKYLENTSVSKNIKVFNTSRRLGAKILWFYKLKYYIKLQFFLTFWILQSGPLFLETEKHISFLPSSSPTASTAIFSSSAG